VLQDLGLRAHFARCSWSCCQQFQQPRQIAGGHGHRHLRSKRFGIAQHCLGHRAHGFGSLDGRFDFLAPSWSAPIEWSDMNVSAWSAFGLSGRCFWALVDGSPERCAA